MPPHDDLGIPNNGVLIRAVQADWILRDATVERITSATFVAGQMETSCFLADEVGGVNGFQQDILPLLEQELGKSLRIATVPVSDVRARGLWVYRKPEEFRGNPAHVVIAAPEGMSKSQYKKAARSLAGDAQLQP